MSAPFSLSALPECPKPIAAVLERLPPFPGSFVLATALNAILASQLPGEHRVERRGEHDRSGKGRQPLEHRRDRARALRQAPGGGALRLVHAATSSTCSSPGRPCQ